ncbi:hypothetical protein J2Z21_008891 [Streptomyces griseochromogenes]|uniref:Uncharacterized protein n=1 Tax=Streptomyces griseochromogenes TaxID=68214 RepID=A0A1B1AZT4_9ACTN|nr:hypothetical protein [Streptomyces griseochromogenes]ANP52022.1 hypothetical protein AVL59_22765 [Streptomyces griseochromogenes]MBP2055875.1 hypothetical protein [Streptomyces griseochromogenes]
MTDGTQDRSNDGRMEHLLQDTESSIDINLTSLTRRKQELQEWMEGTEHTDRCEDGHRPARQDDGFDARPRFVAWAPDLELKPPRPSHTLDDYARTRLHLAVGDHAHAAHPASTSWRPSTCRDESAEAALSAVSELRAVLTLIRPGSPAKLLQTLLADVEDQITRTGQISAGLCERLRTVLTETPLGSGLDVPASAVARLLGDG